MQLLSLLAQGLKPKSGVCILESSQLHRKMLPPTDNTMADPMQVECKGSLVRNGGRSETLKASYEFSVVHT